MSVAVYRIFSGIHLYPVYVLPPITHPWTRQIKRERDPPTNCIRVSYLIVHHAHFRRRDCQPSFRKIVSGADESSRDGLMQCLITLGVLMDMVLVI